MLLRKQKKLTIDTFLTQRGINLSNYHFGDNSIIVRKVLKLKNQQNAFNLKYSNRCIINTPIKTNKLLNKLIYRDNESSTFDINKNKNDNNTLNKKSYISNNHLKDKSKIYHINNSNTPLDSTEKKITLDSNTFFNTNNKEHKKVFSGFMQNNNRSSENILRRFNKNKNTNININNNTTNKIENLYDLFSPNKTNRPVILKNNQKISKLIYEKKNVIGTFRASFKKFNLSRNNKKVFYTNKYPKNKNNSISHSIDFSIINKINLNEMFNNAILSKTSDNFYIPNNKNKNNINNKFQISTQRIEQKAYISKNMKFLKHFIKYCYIYFMEIIKKFFNNLKKIKIEKLERQYSFDTIIHYNNYKNKNKNKNNIFYEFNNDDYDKETIKNKTSENFYDTYNDKNFSFISECKKIIFIIGKKG